MYTKDGEVNNPALIDRFLSRRSWAAGFFPRTDTPIPTTASFKIIIRGNNQANLITTSSGRSDTVKTDITAQRPDYAVLTGRDSLTVLSPASGMGRCEVLIGQMEKEQPVKRCVPMSLATGYSRQCKFRPVRLLKINAGQLFIPQLSWLVQSGPLYNSCGYTASGSWNLFNAGIPGQMVAGDTVVVQERTIALVKK
ncbi:hypothetical protein [Hymenobacter properus]|uniref:Uncharacterized protein n=1 Tax=Hymenobacter properus TaxID=2791026 RepID=A0A931BL60_9BACT|nr:hypothetical protein [Hymenobacter properus]MBF9143377.1 hypothetical protein [Hymenobacter properus]MBR7722188.1 hypothetical protein [Microvirga sp. SRT04]